jgi:putative intracellular protease/amidase
MLHTFPAFRYASLSVLLTMVTFFGLVVALGEARAAERTIVVVAQNGGTEVTDFLVPYGVLSRADVGDVRAVSTEAGSVVLWPGLTVEVDETIDQFDSRLPQGADLVIIPAVLDHDDEVLIGWLKQQADKGAMLVSICDGALILARTGVLDGRRATGHWFTEGTRRDHFPDVTWQTNVRYVHDGTVATSAGVSASLPISLYLVEQLADKERAEALARELGMQGYGAAHNSDVFGIGAGEVWVAARNFTFGWPRDVYALALSDGMDEIALAFAVDMLSRTYRSEIVAVGSAPTKTLGGLVVMPARLELGGSAAVISFDGTGDLTPRPGAFAPKDILLFLADRYGRDSADFVALQLEYPR